MKPVTRTDAVLAAMREEFEAWRPSLDAAPRIRCVTAIVMLRADGTVRTVLIRPESEREAERFNGGVVRL